MTTTSHEMSTTTEYQPGTVVIDYDGDALRIIEDRGSTLFVEYRDDRIIVLSATIDRKARPHFRIQRDTGYTGQGAPWFVTSDIPDPSGDHIWGHFPTHAGAIAFADAVNTH